VAEWVLVLSADALVVGAPAGRSVPLAVARRTGGLKRFQGPGGISQGLPAGARRWLPEGQSGGQRIQAGAAPRAEFLKVPTREIELGKVGRLVMNGRPEYRHVGR